MAGLLSDVLPFVYSRADAAKRALSGLLGDPLGTLQQAVGNANDKAGGLLAMTDAATREGNTYGPATQALANVVGNSYFPTGIVSPRYVIKRGGSAALPTGEPFASAVANTPGARIADEGLYMRVTRNQAPEQALQPSVRGGVFYLPEGAAQAKYYSTGRNGYGGTERIAGETLIQNPLLAKGATGGKAPQMAYDMLNGKGAYDAMRTDALNSVLGYGMSPARKIEATEEFLAKYAPDMSGMGSYIVQNSRSGNQLPYALQEAAVGSAARKAGHDAVLGYSTNKAKQPFLSELFDVRESAYPDKFGTFRTWE